VTFDDGYLDNWVHAFPVLKKLGVKAAMYLVTSLVERQALPREGVAVSDTRRRERDPGGFLSWAEARAMADSGLVTFGSHTHTHRDGCVGNRMRTWRRNWPNPRRSSKRSSSGPAIIWRGRGRL